MAYYDRSQVHVTTRKATTESYSWGDKCIRFVRCKTCGCIMYWEPTAKIKSHRMGVNMRNFEPEDYQTARVRRFDGAKTWRFLD